MEKKCSFLLSTFINKLLKKIDRSYLCEIIIDAMKFPLISSDFNVVSIELSNRARKERVNKLQRKRNE